MKTPRSPSQARAVLSLASIMCITLWTQWILNEELPTTRPALSLPAILVTGDTSQAVLAAAASDSAGPPKRPPAGGSSNSPTKDFPVAANLTELTVGNMSEALLAGTAAATEGRMSSRSRTAVAAATTAISMHAARLFADVDPGGCGALALRHNHLQDSNEAGAMGRGVVPGACSCGGSSVLYLWYSVRDDCSFRSNYT